jgi:NAD(P)-dependent dehydrogenase (short-subunit alcohol dehydrogenase family)
MTTDMLTEQVVLITGGAGLLGQAFVKAVAGSGAIAVIADINLTAANQTKDAINAELGTDKVDAIQIDITDKDSINAAITAVHDKYGKIDALVNNAYPRNKQYGRELMDVEYSDFCQNMNLNLGGYFLTSQQFAAYFFKQGYGNIVNIASIYGVIAPKFEVYDNTPMIMPVEYAVIKSGLIHLTKYLAKSFKGENIRVNALSPGGIEAGQPEAFLAAYKNHCLNKGMLDKTDMAGTLLYLLSNLSQYTNGQNIVVDDGFTL